MPTPSCPPPGATIRIHFRYKGPRRCEARLGPFLAIVDGMRGTRREPYAAAIFHDGVEIAGKVFASSTAAQDWCREHVRRQFEGTTTFELADFEAVDDLKGRFERRSQAYARRFGLSIVRVTEKRVTLANRPTIVRTYHCVPATSEERRA